MCTWQLLSIFILMQESFVLSEALEDPLERTPSISYILPSGSLDLGTTLIQLRQDMMPSFPHTTGKYVICAGVPLETGVTDMRLKVVCDATNKSSKEGKIYWHAGKKRWM